MSNYQLVSEPDSYVSVSGLGNYVTGEGYSPVGNFVVQEGYSPVGEGEEPAPVVTAAKTDSPVVIEEAGGWKILTALAVGVAAWTVWKARKAGVSLMPVKGLFSDLGHSGRTYFGRIGKRRGWGHHKTETSRFHFHPRG